MKDTSQVTEYPKVSHPKRTESLQWMVLLVFAAGILSLPACRDGAKTDNRSERVWKSLTEDRGDTAHSKTVWRSDFHDVVVAYSAPWEQISSVSDSEKLLLAGWIDWADGKSYTIKVTRNVSDEQVTDEQYHDAIRQQMFVAHPANELIDEKDVMFHNSLHRRFRFKMHTEQWGKMCMHAYVRRGDGRSIGVQAAFPYDERLVAKGELPDELKQLDARVKLFETMQAGTSRD